MTGQELYETYRRITVEIEACEIEETWDSLPASSKAVWNTLAEQALEQA